MTTAAPARAEPIAVTRWSAQDSTHLYGIDRWGDRYFSVSADGHVVVRPDGPSGTAIDLKQLVDRIKDRGLSLPVLIRFNGILRDRLTQIGDSFAAAIAEHEYPSRYRCIYPIKVNQQREVVEPIAGTAARLGYGIEAGSKPELLAAVAMTTPEVMIVCNGFKDAEFIRLAMMTQRMGRRVLPVIEKASELDLVLRISKEVGVRPTFGMRVKLATRGTGRWQASGGYRSKFGLTVAEVLASLDRLIAADMGDCLQLLHFHVGSQIGNIRQLKVAITEGARIYADLKLRGAGLTMLDVGGGLGVDYDGSQTDTQSSMNYTLQEYANDVVYHVQSVCRDAEVDPPELLSESGRAIAAHHSVLVIETVGVTRQGSDTHDPWVGDDGRTIEQGPPEDYEQPVADLWRTFKHINARNALESFHDAQDSMDAAMALFSGGYLPLQQRVAAENLYFALCHRVRHMTADMATIPPDLQHLDRMLSDLYFVNFSLFQSMPDAWAIDQLFPIMPIHRLTEEPTRHGILGDITCDSDGKVDTFVSGDGHCKTLRLHPVRADEPYQLGIFMVGAYQEILGDLHNLFGDTHAVHVEVEDGAPKVRSVVKGDTVSEVLSYVQYDDRQILEAIQTSVEDAIGRGELDHAAAGQTISTFEKALAGYTYLSSAQ